MNIRELSNQLESLVIFRAVLDDAVIARLRTALGALEAGEGAVGALADFESACSPTPATGPSICWRRCWRTRTCASGAARRSRRSRPFGPAWSGSSIFSRSWAR